MMLTRRSVTVGSAALATSALVLGTRGPRCSPRRRHRKTSAEGGQVVLDWERSPSAPCTPCRCTPRYPIAVGVPILGFVSLTMYRAAQRSAHLGASSESAAVARAAHDVLAYYVPEATTLDADLQATYDAIGPGHARTKGDRIGAEAARDYLASRADDGWRNPTSTTPRPREPACWWPNTGQTDMVAPWLGSLRPLFVPLEPQSGPYPLTSAAWAADYEEVRPVGSPPAPRTSGRPTRRRRRSSTTAPTPAWRSGTRSSATSRPTRRGSSRRLASSPSCTARRRTRSSARGSRSGTSGSGVPSRRSPACTTTATRAPRRSRAGRPSSRTRTTPTTSAGTASATSPQVEVVRRVLGEATPLEMRSSTGAARLYAHAVGDRVRRLPRPDLGWSALPQGDGRHLRHGAPHGDQGDLGPGLTGA